MKVAKNIFSISTILVGIFLTALGLILYACNIGTANVKGEDFTKTLEIDSLNKIDLINECGYLTVKVGDEFKIECENVVENNLEYSFSSGKLSVRYDIPKILSWIQFEPFTKAVSEGEITITLPESELDEATIKNEIGQIHVSDLNCKNGSLKNGVGEFQIENSNFTDSLSFDNGVGDFVAKNCTTGSVELKNGIGELNLKNCVTDGDITIENGIGEINLVLDTYGYLYEIDTQNGIGEIDIDDNSRGFGESKYTIKAKNGIGEINVEFTAK